MDRRRVFDLYCFGVTCSTRFLWDVKTTAGGVQTRIVMVTSQVILKKEAARKASEKLALSSYRLYPHPQSVTSTYILHRRPPRRQAQNLRQGKATLPGRPRLRTQPQRVDMKSHNLRLSRAAARRLSR